MPRSRTDRGRGADRMPAPPVEADRMACPENAFGDRDRPPSNDVSPSKIRERLHRSHLRVTAPMAASRGADCPAECCVYRRSSASGYAAPIHASPFLTDRDGLPPIPAPPSMKKEGSSSRELGSPPEFVVPASARSPGRLPWGLDPLRGVSPASPPPTGIPGPPTFRPQRFARSRRFAPRCALQTCFILLPRPGFALQGFPPPTQPVPPRRWPVPSRRSRRLLPPVARRRQRASHRPQGLVPGRDPQRRQGC